MINAYISHTDAKRSILLPVPASDLNKLLHVGTRGTLSNRYPGFHLLVMRLALCNHGTLGTSQKLVLTVGLFLA
jgi:hypothetical protein